MGLQRSLTSSARWSSLAALPVALGLWMFGDAALAMVGAEFVAAESQLHGLVAAQFLNVVVGSVGLVLMMSGHVRSVCVGLAVSGGAQRRSRRAVDPVDGGPGRGLGHGHEPGALESPARDRRLATAAGGSGDLGRARGTLGRT